MQITPHTMVSSKSAYAPMPFSKAMPDVCLGDDVDDAWLMKAGLARISTPADYACDPKTQIIVPVQQPSYNAATNLWDAFAVSSTSLPAQLGNAIAAKCAAIDAQFQTKQSAGAHWSGILFQVDEVSQTRFAGAGAYALGIVNNAPGAKAWPAKFSWTAADNTPVSMTAAECYDFAQTMGFAISALALYASALKAGCRAALDLATLDAIDITKNWPVV